MQTQLTAQAELRKDLMYTDIQVNNIINKTVKLLKPDNGAKGLLRFYLREMAASSTSGSDFNVRIERFIKSALA